MRSIAPLKTLAFLAAVTLLACEPGAATGPSDPLQEDYAPSLGIDLNQFIKVSRDLYYLDKTVGTGATAISTSQVTVGYTGYLVDGTVFESSESFGPEPLSGLITGWEFGINGMKVGGTRRLVIGSSWAYGSNGNGPIPPHATLIFDVTLKAVK